MKSIQHTIDSILERLQITALNEMQQAALEAGRTNKDIVLLSATGSGKTLAFLLPLVQSIRREEKTTQALIIVPSRELAQQIESVFKSMKTGLNITCCYGGHPREIEERSLKECPEIVVGTPGRLSDHLRRNSLHTQAIACLILDEFDKSLDLGFQEEMSEIIAALPHLKRRMLTSATEAVDIPDFVGLTQAIRLHFLSPDNEPSGELTFKSVLSPTKDKLQTLFSLLCALGKQTTIVFCNHRESVERVSNFLTEKGVFNDYYHGAMEQKDRDSVLFKFRNGSLNILVATDLAARGLDIPSIDNIVHYHLPTTEDAFTHRNGRTARVDASGTVLLILSPEEVLPDYIDRQKISEEISLPEQVKLPEKPQWITLFIAAGKKDKINKVDIVGFLTKKGQLEKGDIGLIEVRDFFSFVAIRKSVHLKVMQAIKGEKIKNRKILIELAR